MDFVSGALPNVMFIVGMIAIGIALGIEFKIVEVKGQLSKNGRIGAFGVGAALIVASIFLYTRPAATANTPAPAATAAQVNAAAAQPPAAQSPTLGQAEQPPVAAAATPAPSATPVPPTDTPVPSATPEPPSATPEPTATSVPPTTTAVPGVTVPDIRGQSSKDATKHLKEVGLLLGDKREQCELLGMSGENVRRVKKGLIACQSVIPGGTAAPNARVDYVLSGGGGGENED